MTDARRIVVVGGGISGLSAAAALVTRAKERGLAVDVTLLEQAGRVGGNIETEERDGFTLDGGPDSWVRAKPAASALATRVGLESELIGTNPKTRHVYVADGDSLRAIPEGLVLAIPTKFLPVATTPLFSLRAKARMAMEPFVKRGKLDGSDDESVGQFMTRRLGSEVTSRLAAPMLGGIFAGDVAKLSVRAAFPQLVEMERKYGSLVRGMDAGRRLAAKSGPAPSAFTSLRGGLGTLISGVTSQMNGATVRFNSEVVRVDRVAADSVFALTLRSGEVVFADEVLLASPAYASGRALRDLDQTLASQLEAIPYVSTATVFYAFRRVDVAQSLDAVGFVVPRAPGRGLLASTWVSSKWEHRAPENHVLIRAFFGGAWGEEVLEKDDSELAAEGLRDLSVFMKFVRAPLFSRVFRFPKKMPQPVVGHLDRIRRIRERTSAIAGLQLIGNAYDGIGIPDCVKQAELAADAALSRCPPA